MTVTEQDTHSSLWIMSFGVYIAGQQGMLIVLVHSCARAPPSCNTLFSVAACCMPATGSAAPVAPESGPLKCGSTPTTPSRRAPRWWQPCCHIHLKRNQDLKTLHTYVQCSPCTMRECVTRVRYNARAVSHNISPVACHATCRASSHAGCARAAAALQLQQSCGHVLFGASSFPGPC